MTAEIVSLADRRAEKGAHTVSTPGGAYSEDEGRAKTFRLLRQIAVNLGIDGQGPFAYPPKPGPGGQP